LYIHSIYIKSSNISTRSLHDALPISFNNMTFPFQRAFAVEAQNVTNKPLNVRFTIANQPTGGSASFLQFSPLTTLDLTIPAFSSDRKSTRLNSSHVAISYAVFCLIKK